MRMRDKRFLGVWAWLMHRTTRGRSSGKEMVVLKGIPRILSPQLLSVLARMGHGDEIGTPPISFLGML